MMTVAEATAEHEAAQSALDRLDAEIRRAGQDENDAREAWVILQHQRDAGTSDDPAGLLRALTSAQELHDRTLRVPAQLERMRPPLNIREIRAMQAVRSAMQDAARPEADRLEEQARRAWDDFITVQLASYDFRRENHLNCTGDYAGYEQSGHGLVEMASKRGFDHTNFDRA